MERWTNLITSKAYNRANDGQTLSHMQFSNDHGALVAHVLVERAAQVLWAEDGGSPIWHHSARKEKRQEPARHSPWRSRVPIERLPCQHVDKRVRCRAHAYPSVLERISSVLA